MTPRVSATLTIRKPALQRVVENLRERSFTVVGPTVRHGAIVLDELEDVASLPIGTTDDQRPGSYRLRAAGDGAWFHYNVGFQSWKKFLYPPRTALFSVEKSESGFSILPAEAETPQLAFIGVRPCELKAIELQDRVFTASGYVDPHYTARRRGIFVLAVNCSKAAPTCFCTSMKSGPRVEGGFDLALTELPDAFVVSVGSEAGSDAMRDTEWTLATAFDLGRAHQVVQQAERQISRELRVDDLPKMLFDNLENPHWRDVASRCVSCANCTMVCPTCFCSTVEDSAELTGAKTERTRVWDSCFTTDFSHVHGGNLRPTIRSRYRQRVTHKFASWKEQFGSLGCTGCGRCMTWCPMGLEVTREIEAIRQSGASR